MLEGAHLLWTALGVMLAGVLKGVSGVGFPSIATPVVSVVLGVRTAGIVLALPGLLLNASQLLKLRPKWGQIRLVLGFLAGTAGGLALGTYLVIGEPDLPLGALLGGVGLLYVFSRWWKPHLRIRWMATQAGGTALGLFSGALKGATNVSGPLLVAYLQQLELDKDSFAGVSSFILQFTGLLRVGLLLALGAYDRPTLVVSLLLVVPALLGLALGEMIRARLSEQRFQRFTVGLLGVLSVALILRDMGP